MDAITRRARRLVGEAAIPVRAALIRRRFHAYCIGTPKSGTHSIAAVFARYRTAHQPLRETLNAIILARLEDNLPDAQAAERVREWDRRLWLEMTSECNTYFILDLLLAEFPDSRFILTIRDPYTWLDSFLNHGANFAGKQHRRDQNRRLGDIQFKADQYHHAPQEQPLAERGSYTLDGYFSYWAEHNQAVIDRVPPERLLVVRTPDIGRSLPQMAGFLSIPAETLDAGHAHEFRSEKKLGLLDQLDRAYLESKIEAHCRPLLDRFFPEITSLDDAMKK